jgi:arabinofuranosyltransferase
VFARFVGISPVTAEDGITRRTVWVSLLGSVALLLGLQSWYWNWTTDDAYITFRYARNVATGLGPVFNPGERVEGYTNFLWMMLLAGVEVAGLNMVVSAKVIGAACAIATLGVTVALVRRLSGERWTLAACLAPILLASMPSVAGWSVAGLETPFFTLLITLAVFRFLREQEQPGAMPVSAVLLAMAGMTRPDGVGVALLLFGVALVRALRGHAVVGRAYLTRFALAFLALAGPYMIWRLSYYGYLLPNTFYVKSNRGLIQWMAGVLYVTAGIRKHGGWLLHLVALLPLLTGPLVYEIGHCRWPSSLSAGTATTSTRDTTFSSCSGSSCPSCH